MKHPFSSVEALEARIAPATLYVGKSESFTILIDTGTPGLSDGDSVTWDPGVGSSHGGPVDGLIFGVNAFTSIVAAENAADPHDGWDTIRVGPGTFTEKVFLMNANQLLGNQAGVDARGRVANETVLNNPDGSLVVLGSDFRVDGFVFEGQRNGTVSAAAVQSAEDGMILENSILRNNETDLEWGNRGFGPGGRSYVRHNWFVDDQVPSGNGAAVQVNPWGLFNAELSENRFTGLHGEYAVDMSGLSFGINKVLVQGNEFEDGGSLWISWMRDSSIVGNTFSGATRPSLGGAAAYAAIYVAHGGGLVADNYFENRTRTLIAVNGVLGEEGITIEGNTIIQDISFYKWPAAAIDIMDVVGKVVISGNLVEFNGTESDISIASASGVSISGNRDFDVHVTRNTFIASSAQFTHNSVRQSSAVTVQGSANARQTTIIDENIIKGWEAGLSTSELHGTANVFARGNLFTENVRAIVAAEGDNTVAAQFNFFGVKTARKVASLVEGPVDTALFTTVGVDQAPELPGFQSAAILDLRKPGKAIYTDSDGDRVLVKTNRGAFTWEQFKLEHGPQGYDLDTLTLDNSFAGAAISVSPDKRKSPGDGLVNVGKIDAENIDLRSVSIKGDLGKIAAGDTTLTTAGLGRLNVNSLGFGNTFDPLSASPVSSVIKGSLEKMIVHRNVYGINLRVEGDTSTTIGEIKIGRNLITNNSTSPSLIYTSGDIGSITIGGNVLASGTTTALKVEAEGKIATISIRGDFISIGSDIFGDPINGAAIISAGTTIGDIKVDGDMAGVLIRAAGVDSPANAAQEMTIRSVRVGGDVLDSRILAGYGTTLIRSNVQVGTIAVKGNWRSSDVSAGVESQDGYFGNADDFLLPSGENGIVSRISKIMIGGVILGSQQDFDSFGFVAEEIGSMQIGKNRLALTVVEGESILLGRTKDVQVREVTKSASPSNDN